MMTGSPRRRMIVLYFSGIFLSSFHSSASSSADQSNSPRRSSVATYQTSGGRSKEHQQQQQLQAGDMRSLVGRIEDQMEKDRNHDVQDPAQNHGAGNDLDLGRLEFPTATPVGGSGAKSGLDNTMQADDEAEDFGSGSETWKSQGEQFGSEGEISAKQDRDVNADHAKRKWGESSMSIWGKRSEGGNRLNVREKRSEGEKRKWGVDGMSVWGKRDAEKRKWGDSSMGVWGKRSENDKRKWGDNSMGVWGKRSENDKRKWGDNSVGVWGKRADDEKRKWGDNTMGVWGKRYQHRKRKWGDNGLSIWGKRTEDGQGAEENGAEKRDAGSKVIQNIDGVPSMTGNNKRQRSRRSIFEDEEEEAMERPEYDRLMSQDVTSKRIWPNWYRRANEYEGPKRNWETNTMKVWGKRGLVWDDVPNWGDEIRPKFSDNKRSWSSDNVLRIWGKRHYGTWNDGKWNDGTWNDGTWKNAPGISLR